MILQQMLKGLSAIQTHLMDRIWNQPHPLICARLELVFINKISWYWWFDYVIKSKRLSRFNHQSLAMGDWYSFVIYIVLDLTKIHPLSVHVSDVLADIEYNLPAWNAIRLFQL